MQHDLEQSCCAAVFSFLVKLRPSKKVQFTIRLYV